MIIKARMSDIAVFVDIPSFSNTNVSIVKITIPLTCAINLPGHNCPSKYSATYAVAMMNI